MTADTSTPSGTSAVSSGEDPEQQQPPRCSAKLRFNPRQPRRRCDVPAHGRALAAPGTTQRAGWAINPPREPTDQDIQAQALRDLPGLRCGTHGHGLIFRTEHQQLETFAGTFYSPKRSFLVVPTSKRTTGEVCVHGNTTPCDARWLCQREQGGGDAPEPSVGTRGEERTSPGYCQSSWARLSQKGLVYIPLIFMRLMLLNRYGTFSRGNAGPGHCQPRWSQGKVPSEEALLRCSKNYRRLIPPEDLRPPIEHENTWEPHLRQHVPQSQPHCRSVRFFLFDVVGHTYNLRRPKPTAFTYVKAGCARCCRLSAFTCASYRATPRIRTDGGE